MDDCKEKLEMRREPVRDPKRRLASVIGALLAVSIPVAWYATRPQPALPPNPALAPDFRKVAPDIDERIENTQIKVLRKETLEESLKNLSDVDMFFWPGVSSESDENWGIHGFPLSPVIGKHAIGYVVSNRRFLKVFDELAKLPKDQAARLANSAIDQCLAVYCRMFEDDFAQRFGTAKKTGLIARYPDQVISQISSNPNGTPTLMGERYKLFALALCAGNLGLVGCQPTLLKAAQQAKKDYHKLARINDPKRLSYSFARGCTLYNRQLLCTGLLGTTPKIGGLEGAARFKLEMKSIELTLYDAHATPFDLHGRIGAVPVDYARGRLVVRYLGNTSDEAFEAILAAAKE